jgi:GT2 family glycosyltransferase
VSAPLVSFIVLNWHAEESTLRCVDSIRAQRTEARTEIVVVDNESTLDSRRRLTGGPFRIVALDGNRGFTGGMNAGAAAAEGDFLALLNNDLVLSPDWLATGLAAMEDPAVGLVGGRSDDGSQGQPDGESGFTLPRIDPDGGFSKLLRVEAPRTAVASVDGSHLLARREAWDATGGFDEDFFAYYDEVDFCARVWATGWQVLYEPGLTVWHQRGLSSDRLPLRRSYWAKRNRLLFVAKHFPAGSWLRMTRRAAAEYASDALIGRSGGLRGPRSAPALPPSERLASLLAALWWATHVRELSRRRRRAIAQGQHDEGYRERVRLLAPREAT